MNIVSLDFLNERRRADRRSHSILEKGPDYSELRITVANLTRSYTLIEKVNARLRESLERAQATIKAYGQDLNSLAIENMELRSQVMELHHELKTYRE
jgi:predicted nuclease with TOPRIM domain